MFVSFHTYPPGWPYKFWKRKDDQYRSGIALRAAMMRDGVRTVARKRNRPTPADVAVVYLPVAALNEEGVRLYRSDGLNVRVVQVSTTYNYTGTGLWDILGLGAMQLAVAHQERVMGW